MGGLLCDAPGDAHFSTFLQSLPSLKRRNWLDLLVIAIIQATIYAAWINAACCYHQFYCNILVGPWLFYLFQKKKKVTVIWHPVLSMYSWIQISRCLSKAIVQRTYHYWQSSPQYCVIERAKIMTGSDVFPQKELVFFSWKYDWRLHSKAKWMKVFSRQIAQNGASGDI